MAIIEKETKNGNKAYDINIQINPKPKNCYECPFYHPLNPDEVDTWYEYWDCFLKPIDNQYGCALQRPKDCPL